MDIGAYSAFIISWQFGLLDVEIYSHEWTSEAKNSSPSIVGPQIGGRMPTTSKILTNQAYNLPPSKFRPF